MREIKFRVWTDKQMIYPHEYNKTCDSYQDLCYVPNNEDNSEGFKIAKWEGGWQEEWEEQIIMQFTGLHDKTGKEIYEGDKVKRRIIGDGMDYIDLTCDVRWAKWCFCLYMHDKFITCLDTAVASGCEVIGNIYEKVIP